MAKSSIQMQFNWIFVLIAGSIILAAFFGFITKQKAASEQKIADTLIKDIETLATVAAAGKGAEPIQTPKVEVNFVCTDDCSCNIEVGRWTRSFKEKLIFSPGTLEGTSMVFWAMDWKVPFRVTNFLFLTNRNVKYFFVYADDPFSKGLYQQIRDLLPESLDYEFSKLDLFQARDEDYDKVRFVFISSEPLPPLSQILDKSFAKGDISAVQLMPGKAVFHKKTNPKKLSFSTVEYPWFGEAAAFAALFAEDATMYRCNMQNAYAKLVAISELLQLRAEILEQELTDSSLNCGYQAAYRDGGLFSQYVSLGNEISYDINVEPSFPERPLESKNHELLLEGCPLVY